MENHQSSPRSIRPTAMPRADDGESSNGARRRPPALRLVASAARGGADKGGERDWSRLMAAAQDGDRAAYRTLLEAVTPYVRALASRCFRDSSDIEDAVQDVLLTIHAVRHAYDPDRPFGPWLVAIANRRIIDRLRRQMRARSREIEFTAAHETFAGDAANIEQDGGTVDAAALHAAIADLPAEQRQAVRLLKLQEMSLREAAQTSGKSLSALKVAVHRAIKSLRKRLGAPEDAP
jgi:RNA polymerase sigma-70 factor (ECF subfamily)